MSNPSHHYSWMPLPAPILKLVPSTHIVHTLPPHIFRLLCHTPQAPCFQHSLTYQLSNLFQRIARQCVKSFDCITLIIAFPTFLTSSTLSHIPTFTTFSSCMLWDLPDESPASTTSTPPTSPHNCRIIDVHVDLFDPVLHCK